MAQKSCSNCKHSARVPGNSFIYGQLYKRDQIECVLHKELKEIGEKNKWDNLVMPEVCGKYEPKMVHRCGYCGKIIDKPECEWDLYAGPNITPVCSVECQGKKEAADIANWFAD